MHRMMLFLLGCIMLIAAATDLRAQQRPALSPRDSVTLTLDTNTINVIYGRPSMRGRKIMGQLVPWNLVWRTGANQATHLWTSFDMMLGGVPVPRGLYTFWTLPSPTGWTMIVNKQTGQWGTAYDPSQDLVRFDAPVAQLPAPVDTFTIVLQATGKTSGVLKLLWESTSVSVPFEKAERMSPLSPGDSTEVVVGGKKLGIRYSRPSMRGRVIWGVVVPYDSVWRTGANAATALTTEGDVKIGGIMVPWGSYTLYSIPAPGGLTLIISRRAGGPAAYDPRLDLARISMKMETTRNNVDPFRIWFEPAGSSSATLNLGWADRVFTVSVRGD